MHLSIPALGPTEPPIQWVPVLFPGSKWPGRGVSHPPTSSVEVKERLELYLYAFMKAVLGRTSPLPLALSTFEKMGRMKAFFVYVIEGFRRGCNVV
jgi:hypothetical protein